MAAKFYLEDGAKTALCSRHSVGVISLKKDRQFRLVYRASQSVADRLVVLYYRKNGTSAHRFGISVSKKVGGSVIRNKVRRRLREAYRLSGFCGGAYSEALDLVALARVSAAEASYEDLSVSLVKLIKKAETRAGIINTESGY